MVRFKNRYLVCEVVYTESRKKIAPFSEYELYKCIRDAVIKSYGDYGFGVLKSSLSVKHWNSATSIVLIRAKRGAHTMVQSALTFVKKISNNDAFFNTLHIGGTIRSCYKFLVRHHQQQLPGLLRECKTDGERNAVRAAILSCNNAMKNEVDGRDLPKKRSSEAKT
ncbi:ribonuclease P/MRP protein subunit POP5-like [Pecten maximus]|uniref:ribonuclease P/MRP protein subunit POP5-like n=1 Tax=Pecten maximus TaxID=6579 RepID=UPI0014585157|nr:ribonuclease P/MRP protein subunit POP5-like [Pecten maximus]